MAAARFGDHVVGADEVDLDGAPEGREVVRDELAGVALLRHGALARRDAGAVDENPLDPVRGAGLGERRVDGGLVGHVGLAEQRADLAGDGPPALGVHVEDRDLGALRGQHAGRGLAEAGGAAGHDGRHRIVELHAFLPASPRAAVISA